MKKKDIIVAERSVTNPIVVKDERDFTRGYYTVYDKESEATFFLPGAELEEQIVNENDEPLSFPETIEAMGTINNEDTFYGTAIVDGIKVVDTSIKKGVASVKYEMDEDKVTADDRTVFEKAIQLAALDFNAQEVELRNDTFKENNTYPLIEQ